MVHRDVVGEAAGRTGRPAVAPLRWRRACSSARPRRQPCSPASPRFQRSSVMSRKMLMTLPTSPSGSRRATPRTTDQRSLPLAQCGSRRWLLTDSSPPSARRLGRSSTLIGWPVSSNSSNCVRDDVRCADQLVGIAISRQPRGLVVGEYQAAPIAHRDALVDRLDDCRELVARRAQLALDGCAGHGRAKDVGHGTQEVRIVVREAHGASA